jgi:hypothetical protein
MPAPVRIILTPEEDRTLTELRLAQSLPQRTRDRAHMLRLNDKDGTFQRSRRSSNAILIR